MTEEEIRRINVSRLDEWAEVLAREHATAAVVVGIGHDGVSGQIHICHGETLSGDFVRLLLARVVGMLESGEFSED